MKQFAAHYICLSFRQIFKNHYMELDDQNILVAVHPLLHEVEAIAFYNGILFLSRQGTIRDADQVLSEWQRLQQKNPALSAFEILEISGVLLKDFTLPATVFRIDGINLSSPKFSVDENICIRQL